MPDRVVASPRGRRGARVAAALVAACALVGGAAAAAPEAGSRGSGGQVIRVGALLDLTKGWTSLGRASRVALQLAVADTNAELARQGSSARVRLVVADLRGDPNRARSELRRLAASGVRLFVGPQSSSEVAAVRRQATSLGVLLVSQGSTAHSLAARDNVFRFVPDDVREGEALVALARREGITALVPVWRNDAGNAGLVRSVRARLRALRGTVSPGVRYGQATTDFTATLAAVRSQLATLQATHGSRAAVYLAGFDEVVGLLKAASDGPALRAVRWYGSDGVALTPALPRDRIASAYASRAGYPNPTLGLDDLTARRAAPLTRRIQRRLGTRPDAFALTAYDALRVLAVAATRAPSGATGALRRELVRTANGYRGVTGRIALNAAGDRAFGSFDFWAVCPRPVAYRWVRTWSYVARGPGSGRLVTRQRC